MYLYFQVARGVKRIKEVIVNSLFTFISGGRDMSYVVAMVLGLEAKIIACRFQSLSNNFKDYRNLQQRWIR